MKHIHGVSLRQRSACLHDTAHNVALGIPMTDSHTHVKLDADDDADDDDNIDDHDDDDETVYNIPLRNYKKDSHTCVLNFIMMKTK